MTPNQLTPAELMVLKGLALGLGTCHIKSLLALSDSPYRKIQQQLFQKLQAENAYVAVQRAFQLQILIHAEYSDEMVKETALEMANVFADNVEQDPKNFGDRKTGWFSYNPYKIQVNSLGDIIPMKKENR